MADSDILGANERQIWLVLKEPNPSVFLSPRLCYNQMLSLQAPVVNKYQFPVFPCLQ